MTDDEQVFEVFHGFAADFGTLDRIVINAGIGKGAPLGTGRHQANRETAMTNFVAALTQTEAAMEMLPRPERRPPGDGLVDVGDARHAAVDDDVRRHARPASRTWPRACARSCYGKPIKVTVLYPGYIASEMNEGAAGPGSWCRPRRASAAMVDAIEKEKGSAASRRSRGRRCRWP